MADNLIEQFFIDIELNTKGVGKQAKQIDKMLDNIGNKAYKRDKARNRNLKSDRIRKERDFRAKESSLANKALNSRLKEFKSTKAEAAKVKQAEVDFTAKIENAKTKQHIKSMTQKSEELSAMKRYYKELEKTSAKTAKRVARQEAQIARVQGTSYYQGLKGSGVNTTQLDKRLASAVKRGDAAEIANVTTEMKRLNREMKRHTKTLAGVGMVQKSVTDSTRNMIRSYLSLFALFEGTVAIKRVGMDFEGMEASMLAVAGTADKAAEHLGFLREESRRLGFDMVSASKGYIKLAVAAGDKLSQSELEEVFLSVAESATVFQLSSDDMMGTIKAVQQMFSKSGIMAQEFLIRFPL